MRAKQPLGILSACASLAFSPFSHAQLVGQWLFDEGSGSVYADSSPDGNDAFLEEFDGWLAETPPTGFTGIGGDAARTVACWVKTTATNDHGVVAWGDSTSDGSKWHLRLNSNVNNGTVGAFRVETRGDYTIGNTIVNDGQWYHAAFVFEEDAGPEITWTSRPSESYFVFSSTDQSSAWREEVDKFPATPGGSTTSFTIPKVPSETGRTFFRVSRW